MGDFRGHGLLINSSRLDIDGTVKCLAGDVKSYMQVKGIKAQKLPKFMENGCSAEECSDTMEAGRGPGE